MSYLGVSMEEVGYVVMYVTVPNREVGIKIAKRLIEEKVAACVNIVPNITSVYEWEGKVEVSNEELLIIKTRKDAVRAVEAIVKEEHPYEVPEIIATGIIWGSKDYLDWIDEVVIRE